MYPENLVLYEGTEPFIFISYAHKDADTVIPILSLLFGRGYRVWCDSGIEPGSEWPEYIAEHLNRSAIVIAFISPQYIESANCRREITFAFSKNKKFLGVFLEETDLSLGLEMQLSSQQCILKYKFSSDESFLKKLCLSPDLNSCREAKTDKTGNTGRKESTDRTENTGNTEDSDKTRGTGKTEGTDKTEREVTDNNIINPSDNPKKKKSGRKRKFRTVVKTATMGLMIGILVILGTGRITGIGPLGKATVGNKQVEIKTSSLQIEDTSINASELSDINRLSELTSLTFKDCTFLEVSLEDLKRLDHIKYLTIKNCTGIDDFMFLDRMSSLQYLELSGCGITDDNFDVKDISLYNVNLSNNPGFSDMGLLCLSELKKLNISNTGVTDISVLADAKELNEIYAADDAIEDISALAGLTELTDMNFDNCRISAVTDLFQSLAVKNISFKCNGLTDISGFDNMTVLSDVDLSDNKISEAKCLEKSVLYLEYLDVSNNPAGDDLLNALAKAENMKELHISSVHMDDLSVIDKMMQLEVLDAGECGITDISGVRGKNKLAHIYLQKNKISDISALEKLTSDTGFYINLSDNEITDVSALPQAGEHGYNMLLLYGNPVEPDTWNQNIWNQDAISGYLIVLDYYDGFKSSNPVLEKLFSYYYVIDCPADRQLAVKEVLEHRVIFTTRSEVEEKLNTEGYYVYNWN